MGVGRRAFTAGFSDLEVWSVAAQFAADWDWPASAIQPLGRGARPPA